MLCPSRIKVERINLRIPRFGGLLDRAKIIHLSDLHVSRYGPRERKFVDLVNCERPDLIFITGDMLVNYSDNFDGGLETLRRLEAGMGVYAVLGNAEHTLASNGLLSEFEDRLKALGIALLKNTSVALPAGLGKIHLIGVDDPFFLFDDFEGAVRGVPEGAPSILLAHSPDVLYPRADAMVLNLLDSASREDRFESWGWEDSTRFGPEDGYVRFDRDGRGTLRVQSRQDGVSLDAILLNPYRDLDEQLQNGEASDNDRMMTSENTRKEYPDLVLIPASSVGADKLHGRWKKRDDHTALSGSRLTDHPSRRHWRYRPSADPEDYFEADFSVLKGVAYRLWARMKAYRGDPLHDSVYVQFDGAVDAAGKPRYRIGKSAQAKARMAEVDLILAGHTHGGQVRIPFYGAHTTMTAVGKKYASGLTRVGQSWLYVSRGIGWSAHPIRLFCPPEITVLTFHGRELEPGEAD